MKSDGVGIKTPYPLMTPSFMIQFSLDDKRQSRNWNRKKGNVLILPTPKSALMTRTTTPTLVKIGTMNAHVISYEYEG